MGTLATLAVIYVCGDPECRERCEFVPTSAEWQHTTGPVAGTAACRAPIERREVAPFKAEWIGRDWRRVEAREAAKDTHSVIARRLAEGVCRSGRIRVELNAAWDAGYAAATDEQRRRDQAGR